MPSGIGFHSNEQPCHSESFCGFLKIKSWLRRTTFSAVLMWRWHLQWWSFGCESRSRVKKGLMLLGMDVWLSSFLVGKAFLVCLAGNPYWPSIIFWVQTVFCWNLFWINWNPSASGIRTRVRFDCRENWTGKNDWKTTFHTYTHTHRFQQAPVLLDIICLVKSGCIISLLLSHLMRLRAIPWNKTPATHWPSSLSKLV